MKWDPIEKNNLLLLIPKHNLYSAASESKTLDNVSYVKIPLLPLLLGRNTSPSVKPPITLSLTFSVTLQLHSC
jgi:hypothetical protein